MRLTVAVIVVLTSAAASPPAALAQANDFSGKWSVSGQLTVGASMMIIAPICDFKQTGDQIAGTCKGPNGGCSAVGVIDGPNIDWTCRTRYTNAPNLSGFSTFHGTVGADAIVRGSWTHSRFPRAGGRFTMQRV
jgi:hypothetical protein